MFRTSLIVSALAISVAPQRTQQTPPNINGGLPYVSPDGSLIAFVANRGAPKQELFVIRPDGTGEKQVTTGGGSPPQWMPDGKSMVYALGNGSPMADSSDLMIVGLDGNASRPFARVVGRGALLSPDGKWFVTSAGRFPNVKVTVLGRDGSGARDLTSGPGMAFNAVWSPDGTRIAYARMDSTRDMQMWIVNADGTGNRQLTKFVADQGRPQWPSWSPDGKRIAVQSGVYNQQNRALNTAHIWIIDVESGAATKLAAHDKPYLDETPSFFPDGKRIAFQSDRSGRMEVWVMNVDGTGARQVTR